MSIAIPDRTIVRTPARDRHTRLICAECGRLVDQEEAIHRIEYPAMTRQQDQVDQLRVVGWKCDEHSYQLVMPRTYYDKPTTEDGRPVEIVYADRIARWVVTPDAKP